MNVSQKCQYALRAIFELSRRQGNGVTPISALAEAQAIPSRFLEQILGQLRQGGFVESRRGVRGGYRLVAPPEQLTVGQIIEFIDGPLTIVRCLGHSGTACRLTGHCAFTDLWERARRALTEVYHRTSFQDLVRQHEQRNSRSVLGDNI